MKEGPRRMIRNFLQRFMYGRYGSDALSFFLLGCYVVLYLISYLADLPALYLVADVLLLWGFFRILSRNYERRRAENAAFLGFLSRTGANRRARRARRQDKEHRYYRCKQCGAIMRVPRGVGKIEITCPKCGAKLTKKV